MEIYIIKIIKTSYNVNVIFAFNRRLGLAMLILSQECLKTSPQAIRVELMKNKNDLERLIENTKLQVKFLITVAYHKTSDAIIREANGTLCKMLVLNMNYW